MIRRKKLACLGLAASMTLPQGFAGIGLLLADQTSGPAGTGDMQPQPTNSALLNLGIDQYNKGFYEESVATLQQVDVKSLGQTDRQTLVDMLAKANAAATDRRAALSELAQGDEARKANQLTEASQHYQAVLSDAHADADTQKQAQQRLTQVQTAQNSDSDAAKAAYKQAVDEYRQGLWQQARVDFTKAEQLGYTSGFFEAGPAEYLKKLDEGEQKYMATSMAEGKAAYDRGRDEYRSGDMGSAKLDFVKARDLGYQPNYLEGLSPTEYLQRMGEAETADAQPASATPASVSATSSSAALPSPVPTADSTPKAMVTGKAVYLADSSTQSGSSDNTADQSQLEKQAEIDRLAQQQRIFKAKKLVEDGATAEKAGDDQGALNDYTQAVDLDSTNTAATEGHDRLLAKLGRGPASGGASLNKTAQQIQQESGSIRYKFDSSLDQARKDTAANQFAAARDDIANAQAARDEDPSIFNSDELNQMNAQIQQATLDLKRASQAYDLQQRRLSAANAEANIRENANEEQARRDKAVAALIKLSRGQIEQHDYQAALGVLDQILTLDPQNDYALGVHQLIEDKAAIQEQRHYRQEFDSNFTRILNQADEAEIPYEDIYRFPENWPDISTMRDDELKDQNVDKEDQAAQALLDHRLPRVTLPGVALGDAIEFLRDLTGANFFVVWKDLEADSIDKTTQVTLDLHDVKFSTVLDKILQEAGGGKLGYTIDQGVITIDTSDQLNKAVFIRLYDITDLLVNPNFDPMIQNAGGGSAQVSGSGGGGGGNVLQQSGQGTQTQDKTQQLQDLKRKIENTVEPSTWKDNDPNGYGQIDDLNNQLIITQTSDVHNKIANLLAQIREAQAVQVSIEARFLTVSRHFLDDVGVNIGLTLDATSSTSTNLLNGITAATPPNQWEPTTITNGTAAFTASPSTGLPGSLGNNPVNGLGVSGHYGNILDDFQVDFLISAVEASERLSIVHAPRVTLQNGQGATIIQTTFIPYVSSLNVSVATGAAIAAPVISNAEDGVQLSVERAIVSADHKYVTLDIDPQLVSFLGFTTFQFEIAAAATVTTPVTGGTTVVTGGFSAPTLSVQEATELHTEVRTRVTVPDGGTLLLGGVTIAGEINLEAGIPGLSKIPFLKRLTSNSSEANDEQVLLILVKPTILINKEIEAKNFPLLTGGK